MTGRWHHRNFLANGRRLPLDGSMIFRVMFPCRPLLIGLCGLWLAGMAQAALWTDVRGRSFEAKLLSIDGQSAMFRLANGRTVTLAWNQLSTKDQMKLRLMQPQSKHGRPLAPMSVWRNQEPAANLNREVAPVVPSAPVHPVPAESTATPPQAGQQRPLNFGYAWPMHTRIHGGSNVKVISEMPDKREFVYESPHYRFISDVKLNLDVLRQFSVLFETTHQYVRALPLAVDGGRLQDRCLVVLLYESMASYCAAGGSPGAAACYVPSTGVVMAPLQSLGVKRVSNSFSMDMDRNNCVLIHELAHQLTPAQYIQPILRNGWFIEGFAEYVGSTPYNWGYFRADPYGNAAMAYVTALGEDGSYGRRLGKKIVMPRLERLLNMNYREFAGGNGNLHYGVSLLLVHYYLHLEGNGKARRMIQYLKGLRAGKTGDEALQPLLVGGSYAKLEQDFANAWKKKGVEITFAP